ncbi:hypothetical protein F25303_3791 [Fusarium sp. NRRL 25303]|nr:hypothetical protein F25303_3791 [Fusarium sp. NRRL 25303]
MRLIALDVHTAKSQRMPMLAGFQGQYMRIPLVWQAHATKTLPEVADVAEYGIGLRSVEAYGHDAEARGVDLGSAPVVGGLYVDVVQLNAGPAVLAVYDHFLTHELHLKEVEIATLLDPLEVAVRPLEVGSDEARALPPGRVHLVVPAGVPDPHEVTADLAVTWRSLRVPKAVVYDAAVHVLEHDLLVGPLLYDELVFDFPEDNGIDPWPPGLSVALLSANADHVTARPHLAKAPRRLGRDAPVLHHHDVVLVILGTGCSDVSVSDLIRSLTRMTALVSLSWAVVQSEPEPLFAAPPTTAPGVITEIWARTIGVCNDGFGVISSGDNSLSNLTSSILGGRCGRLHGTPLLQVNSVDLPDRAVPHGEGGAAKRSVVQ